MYKKPKIIHTCNKLILIRHRQTPSQTMSTMLCLDENDATHYLCVSLELPMNANKVGKSAIPFGTYEGKSMIHQKFGRCLRVYNVANRTELFVHAGNFIWNTKGCILPGTKFRDIDGDGTIDVDRSGEAMFMLWWTLKKKFTLVIH